MVHSVEDSEGNVVLTSGKLWQSQSKFVILILNCIRETMVSMNSAAYVSGLSFIISTLSDINCVRRQCQDVSGNNLLDFLHIWDI